MTPAGMYANMPMKAFIAADLPRSLNRYPAKPPVEALLAIAVPIANPITPRAMKSFNSASSFVLIAFHDPLV